MRACALAVLLSSSCLAPRLSAEPLTGESRAYLQELIGAAHAQRLWEEPFWRKLLHYKKDWMGRQRSQVDGRDFFNAPSGEHDPQAELEATLARFFSSEPVAPTNLTAQCRFIARYHWLSEKLAFDPARLPPQRCELFESLVEALQPVGITVVFPAAHPNSPSSMFGHTFIRIDKAGQTKETRMLDFTVNYAAQVDVSNGFSYAVRGLTGGFEGRFNVLPYHLKMREYAQMENRDIWEYRLNLTPAQVRLVLEHVYELVPTYFDYYFFTENCAYHLLSLLDVALPGQSLTDEFEYWTIPVDTLKLMERRYAMVTEVACQPARKTVIEARRATLDADEQALALRVAREGADSVNGELTGLSLARQAAVLDLGYDYLRYNKIKKDDELRPDLNAQERALLLARSRLKVTSDAVRVPPPADRPDRGHDTARLVLGGGVLDEAGFARIGYRAAYHDLLDPAPGYSETSRLDFFNVELRYYDDSHRLELAQFTLLDILSLEPRDDFFKDISWHVNSSWTRRPTASGREGVFTLAGGPGLTYRVGRANYFYGLLEAVGEYSGVYEDDTAVAGGVTLGLLAKPVPRWKLQAEATARRSFGGDELDLRQLAFNQSYVLGRNRALRLDLSHVDDDGHGYWEALGGIQLYF